MKDRLLKIPTYMENYLKLANEDDAVSALKNSWNEASQLLSSIDESQGNFTYAENKWKLKEVLLHVCDTERIFQYRSLCISRGERQRLPGFDQDEYAQKMMPTDRSFKSILQEFEDVRKSSISLYESLSDDQLLTKGMVGGIIIQPLSYAYVSSGHLRHHLNIISSKYLSVKQT